MKSTWQVLAICIVAAMVVVCRAWTPLQKCKGDGVHPAPSMDGVFVNLGNCTKWPCILKRNKDYGFEQRFTAPFGAETLTSAAIGWISGFAVPLSSTVDTDFCKSLSSGKINGNACPVKTGRNYVYRKKMHISKKQVEFTFNAHWHLVNEAGDCLTCFEIPIKLVGE